MGDGDDRGTTCAGRLVRPGQAEHVLSEIVQDHLHIPLVKKVVMGHSKTCRAGRTL